MEHLRNRCCPHFKGGKGNLGWNRFDLLGLVVMGFGAGTEPLSSRNTINHRHVKEKKQTKTISRITAQRGVATSGAAVDGGGGNFLWW